MSANNIQVALKVRPINKKEKDKTPNCVWKIVENSIHYVDGGSSEFVFDYIFDQDVNTNEVFDKMAKPIVDSALKGINGTIFAYGQTASGKTYTMLGDENNPGVMVLTAREIFKEIEEACDREFLLRVAYFQIYNEKIFDLLTKSDQDLKIHENSNGDVIVNCKEFIITSQDEMMGYLFSGSKLRRCGETNMNECSSRSHAIFRIIIESRELNKTSEDGSVQISVLNLVDLAGSERANQTGATGSRSKEGSHINRSLLFLSCVIKQLSENDDKYINYRDSKLTRILQASLGGNALTAIICTITPTVFEETQSTLKFAMRAKKIKNKPQVNEVITDSAMMKKQEKEISRLKKALEIEKTKNSKLKVTELERQIYKENLKIICSHSAVINKDGQRRRTWCPSYYDANDILKEPTINIKQNSDTERDVSPNLLPGGSIRSQIPKYYTPLIGISVYQNDNNNDHFDIDAENIIIPTSPNNMIMERENLRTPPNVGGMQPAIITPKPTVEDDYKRIAEELESLQKFTNLENKLKVQYDTFDIIQQELSDAHAKIVKYEQDAIHSINLKEQLSTVESNLVESEDRSKQLQQKIKELEIEKREFISMEFEFQQLKNKSKLRESELLEVIHEKESQVFNLENSLKSTKENQNVSTELPNDCICINHIDLEKILSEKSKLQSEVNLLKQDYEFNQLALEKLQSENKKLLDENVCMQTDFELQKNNDNNQLDHIKFYSANIGQLKNIENSLSMENESKSNQLKTLIQENKAIQIERDQYKEEVAKLQLEYDRICKDCEKLRVDCTEIRQMYTKHKSEKNLLTEEIQVLNEKLVNLDVSFQNLKEDKLESNKLLTLELEKSKIENFDWQCKHVSTVKEYNKLKILYDEMQLDKDSLESQYNLLETNYNEIIKIQQRLEKPYDDVTNSMNGLTENNVDNHLKFIKTLETLENNNRLLIENKNTFESEKNQLIVEFQELRLELNALKEKHENLQFDYNKVSEEVMDHIQENENLSNQISKLENEIKENCNKLNSNYCYNGLNVIHENSEEELINSLKSEIFTLKSLNETLTEESQVSKVNIDLLNKKVYEHEINEKELNNFLNSMRKSLEQKLVEYDLLPKQLEVLRATNNGNSDSNSGMVKGLETNLGYSEIETVKDVHIKCNKTTDIDVFKSNGNQINNFAESAEIDKTRDFTKLESEHCDLKETVKNLIVEFENLIDQLQIVKLEKDQIEEKNKNIATENSSLLQKLDIISMDFNRISETMSAPALNSNELASNEMNSLKQKIDSLQNENEQLKQLNQKLTEEVKYCSDQVESQTVKINHLENENTELKMLKDNISEKLDSNESFLHQRLNYLDEENSRLKSKNEQLLIKINSFEEIWEETKNINDITNEFQSKLSSKCNEVVQLSQKCENLEQQVKNQIKEFSNLQELKATADKQIFQLNENIEELIMKYKRLESQCNLQINEYNDLLLKCESEEAKNIELQKTVQNNGSNMAFISQAEEECKELKTSISTLANRIYNLEQERVELLEQKEKLISTIKNITSEVMENGKVQKEKVLALEKERDLFLEEKRELLKKCYSFEAIKNERKQFLEHKRELDEAIAKLEKERDQLINDKRELLLNITNIEALENERDRLLTDKRELKLKVEDLLQLENQRDQLLINDKRELQSNVKIIESLKNDRDKLLHNKKELESKVETITILENERDQLINEKIKIQSNATFMVELKIERDQLLKDKKEIESKLEILIAEKRERDLLLSEKMDNIVILQKELNQFRFENEDVKRNSLAFEALKTNYNDILKANESLQLNLQKSQEELNQIQIDSRTINEELKNEVNRREEICNKLIDENKVLVMNIQKKHDNIIRVQQLADVEIEKSTTNHRIMQADLGERIQRFEQERDELAVTNRKLIAELERIDTLKKHIEELSKTKLEKLNLENKTLNEQISVLKKSSETSIEMLKSKNNFLEKQIDHLKKELQSLHDENIKAHSLIDCKSAEITKIKAEAESGMSRLQNQIEAKISLFYAEKKTLLNNFNVTEIKLKDRIQKLETEINSFKIKEVSNLKTNGFSPKRETNPDNFQGENNQLKMKNMTSEAAHKITQKARRLSSHDESRKSLMWNSTREAQTMTDPTDSSCNCAALDQKLIELKRKLIIRESQVNTLCLEMKTHPMKAENERLKKLLYSEDEQQKVLRKEIKTLKQIILDKTNENKNCLKCLSKSKRSFAESSAQTDAELMATFEISETQLMESDLYKTLMGKKEYLKKLCRNRHARLTELQTQLDHQAKEQNTAEYLNYKEGLEQKYENLLRAYKMVSGKYEEAKIICLSRDEEIEELKQNLKSLK